MSPAKSAVTKWYRKFQFGWQALEDDTPYGYPVTAATAGNILKAKSLMKENSRIASEEMQDALGISSESVNNLLLDHLTT